MAKEDIGGHEMKDAVMCASDVPLALGLVLGEDLEGGCLKKQIERESSAQVSMSELHQLAV